MGDDGVGIAAVERLQSLELPAAVEIIDGGTGGLTLLALMEGAGRVLLIDAVDMGGTPGTIRQFAIDDLLPAVSQGSFSPHANGVPTALRLGHELGLLPPLTLYGIQPARVAPGLGLSTAVSSALEPLLETLRSELQGLR